MYRHLWVNGPKEIVEYPDYTYDRHFGRSVPSYVTREAFRDYLLARMQKDGDIRPWIRFDSAVRMVDWDKEKGCFVVRSFDGKKSQLVKEEFDWVVVATGHFTMPNVPDFKGIEEFTGRIVHSHDFRDAREFKDQNVLVIGRSYSAEDIASHCYKYGAKSIIISYRTKPTGNQWPSNMKEVPLLQSISSGNICTFLDGTSQQFDAIILCTGYQHHFPFLPDELRLQTGNRFWIPDLYKGIVWQGNPKLIYLSMQNQFLTFSMLDAQAWLAREIILSHFPVPSLEDMKADHASWIEEEGRIENGDIEENVFFLQLRYIKHIMSLIKMPQYNLDPIHPMIKGWERHKKENIMAFRDHAFQSIVTGTMAAQNEKPWLEAYDDPK